ncbi:hypothetical protein K458DRAFT_397413 [Lentithecium fluviatile CBS 122367]|uniref:Uncharacterized protein n=1 Tax=Lentithecium fluviatile CBS 122367 TaxID=1168545 RepID=A0A6G1IDM7_9PLEO|nr:hypothetical protein K458DRAFT_397413 [Lentithecium fluviatile CBS 122367]
MSASEPHQNPVAPSLRQSHEDEIVFFALIKRTPLPRFTVPAVPGTIRYLLERDLTSRSQLEKLRGKASEFLAQKERKAIQLAKLRKKGMESRRILNEWQAEWDESEHQITHTLRSPMVETSLLLEPSYIDPDAHVCNNQNVPLKFYGAYDEIPEGTQAQLPGWKEEKQQRYARDAAQCGAGSQQAPILIYPPPRNTYGIQQFGTIFPKPILANSYPNGRSQEYQHNRINSQHLPRQYSQAQSIQMPAAAQGYNNVINSAAPRSFSNMTGPVPTYSNLITRGCHYNYSIPRHGLRPFPQAR